MSIPVSSNLRLSSEPAEIEFRTMQSNTHSVVSTGIRRSPTKSRNGASLSACSIIDRSAAEFGRGFFAAGLLCASAQGAAGHARIAGVLPPVVANRKAQSSNANAAD